MTLHWRHTSIQMTMWTAHFSGYRRHTQIWDGSRPDHPYKQTSLPKVSKSLPKKDLWTSDSPGLYYRHHSKPRQEMFTPKKAEGMSRSVIEGLDCVRVTRVEPTDGSDPYEIQDNWMDQDRAHRNLGISWTGMTMFQSLQPKDEGTYGDE